MMILYYIISYYNSYCDSSCPIILYYNQAGNISQTDRHICIIYMCIYIYIYIFISRPRGDRKFGG